MYIIIGADLVPTKSNIDLFMRGDLNELVGNELMDIFHSASYRIFNLEVPLTDTEKPIIKQGPNLSAPSKTVNGYKALGIDLLTLANNHILDQDISGLENTMATLDSAKINHLGAARNLEAASEPYIFSFGEKRIGVYACVEHEFSIAEENKPGANPFDSLWSFDHVAELKKECDYVIVLYHGGKEHYRYPSPMLQKVCRRFVDKGADLVICQHSHCIGCEEKYQNKTIVYGQGNFIFDDNDDECWRTSLLVRIDEEYNLSYLPLEKKANGVRLAGKEKGEEILRDFYIRSEEIKMPGFVDNNYSDYAVSFKDYYLCALSGMRPVWFRIINKISGGRLLSRFLRNTYRKSNLIQIQNYIDCEAHKELMMRTFYD